MVPGTRLAQETTTVETTEMEDEDEIHQTLTSVTTEVVGTTPMKTSGEGNLTVIQDGPHSL
ncbi:hypothetical protein A2U01_0056455 [Trifolium medium]|uniref:Uncharacterized protein n=1 Tax=Trifolium medium TaxID=97028 RepID=A0A392RGR6_9FABA|nr:hypothetical protein [Trifolium medium]